MRIAFFSQWWTPEQATLPHSLAVELARRGHRLGVVTGFPNYPSGTVFPGYRIKWRQVEPFEQGRVIRVPLYPSHDRSAVRRAVNFASFGAAACAIGVPHVRASDVAYVYHPPITSAAPAMLLRAIGRVPFVLHVQDLWPESVVQSGMLARSQVSRLERVLHRTCDAVYRAAAHILVISPGFKSLLVERGVPEQKISVVYNWADESVFSPVAPSAEARAQLGPPDRRIVLYAGNMGEFQGLDRALLAAEQVGRTHPLHLTFVGDGLARTSLEKLAADRGIPNVTFLPARPAVEVQPLLAAADAHLVKLQDLDFFARTIPGKTQVALASGKPVIMAVRGDAANLVRTAGCGFVAPPDERGLADAFARFASTSCVDLQAMGQAGRWFYERELSISRAGNQIESSLLAAASLGGRR